MKLLFVYFKAGFAYKLLLTNRAAINTTCFMDLLVFLQAAVATEFFTTDIAYIFFFVGFGWPNCSTPGLFVSLVGFSFITFFDTGKSRGRCICQFDAEVINRSGVDATATSYGII